MIFTEYGSLVGCRTYNDIRLYMMFQLIPCIAIPGMCFVFPPKYTHSRYWLWAGGTSYSLIIFVFFKNMLFPAQLKYNRNGQLIPL